jgi:hypothetical protein
MSGVHRVPATSLHHAASKGTLTGPKVTFRLQSFVARNERIYRRVLSYLLLRERR